MTLVDELKAIRDRKPSDIVPMEAIPCRETSDTERLCPHPVVSVIMVTYNHEPYIREAIESVLMQKTDFEVELIIGEDCSQDRTREICFDYQRRYPEKIRVLWSDENVYKISGHERRCIYKARGDYLAFCEGDDYWTDPLKLQKQVDLIRAKNAVMCVAFTDWVYGDGRVKHSTYEPKEFISFEDLTRHYFHTTTYVADRNTFRDMQQRYRCIASWSDLAVEFCMISMGKICLLPEMVSVYRWSGGGVASSLGEVSSNCSAMLMFYDLFLHGPSQGQWFFAARALQGVDWLFVVNRRYRPALVETWMVEELKAAHRFLVGAFKGVIDLTRAHGCVYCLNVWYYQIRVMLVKCGLGCFFKNIP